MRSIYLQEDLENLARYLNGEEFAGSKILITGATGLIGSLCIKAIVEHNKEYDTAIQVIALARSPQKVKAIFNDEFIDKENLENVAFIYQDISMPIDDMIDCEYIIHTANSTTSKFFMTNPVEVIESIYTGTKKILDFGLKKKVKGIVYLSSMEVFGKINSDSRIGESELGYLDIQNIRSCYSEGKRLAELLCKSYASEYGLPVKIARLAQTFGAGVSSDENRVFAQFARSAIKGEDIILHTKGQTVGNYCYTADVVRALFLLLKNGELGDVYTVVNEETTRTIVEMAQMVISKFSNQKSHIIFDIPERNLFGYAPDTKMRLSSAKLNAIGWRATVDLEEMYKRMIPDLGGDIVCM